MFRRVEHALRPHEQLTHTTHVSEDGGLSGVVYSAVVSDGKTLAETRDAGADAPR